MSFLDKFGKVAMDALDKASRVAERFSGPKEDDDFVVPDPEPNESPFAPPPEDEPDEPLGNADKAAQVFGPGTDPWTGRCLQLLTDHQIEHEYVDLEGEGGTAIETRLVSETAQHNPPYVYLRGAFIGGFDVQLACGFGYAHRMHSRLGPGLASP